jgi:hypothetical protein
MADAPPASDAPPNGSASSGGDGHPGMPRWVKAAIAVVLVLVVVLAIGKLAGVEHGPGMHGGSGQTPASQVSEGGTTPPAGAEGNTLPADAEGHAPPPGVDHGQP